MRASLSKHPGLWLAGVALVLLAACAKQPGPSRSAAPATAPPVSVPAGGPVTIAILVPTGAEDESAADLGGALVDAARLAMADFDRRDLRLRVHDTAGRAGTAAAAARRAIAEGADVIVGPLLSDSTRAVGRVAADRGVPVFSFSNDSDVAGGAVYVTGYTPEGEARRVVAHAGRRGLSRVAVFHPANAYGRKALAGAREGAARPLAAVVAYERSFKGIETASERFASAASDSDAVFLPAGGDELKAVGSFLNYHGVDPVETRYLGTGKWNSPATFEEPALRDGLFAAPDPDLAARFADWFASRHGRTPPPLAHLGYDAVRIAGTLVREARDRNPFTRRAILRDRFDGALGAIRFSRDQVAVRALAILSVGPGKEFRVVVPAGGGAAGS